MGIEISQTQEIRAEAASLAEALHEAERLSVRFGRVDSIVVMRDHFKSAGYTVTIKGAGRSS